MSAAQEEEDMMFDVDSIQFCLVTSFRKLMRVLAFSCEESACLPGHRWDVTEGSSAHFIVG